MPKYAEEILAAVTELQQHPTAEQVFLEMKREHPRIALGTVYKHLNGLAEEGLLLRITEPGSPDRYDRTERHDHLICSRCGKITDVRLPDMQERIREALGHPAFNIYHISPHETKDPEQFVTEVCYPVKKADT